jgi:signal transduction histidine kinase
MTDHSTALDGAPMPSFGAPSRAGSAGYRSRVVNHRAPVPNGRRSDPSSEPPNTSPSAWRNRSFGFDVLIAAIAIAIGLVTRMGRHAGLVDWPGVHVVSAVVSGGLLLHRRSSPFWSGLAVCVVGLVHPTQTTYFAAYAAGAYVEDRRRACGLIAGLALVAAQPWNYPDPFAIVGNVCIALVPALLGLYVAARRRLRLDRAERAQAERESTFERVRHEERARIAAEMHDVITHRVSLMVLQAGALRTRARDDDVRATAEELRLVGCKALEELRGLVAVTRSGRQPGSVVAESGAVLDVCDLITDSRTAGVVVELNTVGERRPTSPVVGRAAYRVVQEALTNVHKHAPGAAVVVWVHYTGDEVHITVRNSAPTRAADVALGAGGSGLLGLRKRVELVAGTLRAGPSDDGGYELVAVLPVIAPTARTTLAPTTGDSA